MKHWVAAIGTLLAGSVAAAPAFGLGPIVTVLKPFRGGAGGGAPYDILLPDGAGNLYGVAYSGGVANPNCLEGNFQILGCGLVYELTPPASGKGYWTETVLHDFTGRDGYAPDSPLIKDTAGNLYGTAEASGPMGGGTVFKLTRPAGGTGTWAFTTLHAFGAAGDGVTPSYGGLTFDSQGALYGTTMHGGTLATACPGDTAVGIRGCGTVFKLTPPAGSQKLWTETILYNFSSSPDGAIPASGVTFGPFGYLYGTTSLGGTSSACNTTTTGGGSTTGCGTVFALIPPASGSTAWTESTIVEFNSVNGSLPMSRLVLQNGDFYGTTETGGNKGCQTATFPAGCGTVFQLIPPATSGAHWVLNQVFRFNGIDGEFPLATVSFDPSGNLFGTNYVGGNTACQVTGYPAGCGTVYELVPPANGTVPWTVSFYKFSNGAGGANPAAGVGFYVPGILTVTTTTGGQTNSRAGGFGTALTVHPHMTLVGGASP